MDDKDDVIQALSVRVAYLEGYVAALSKDVDRLLGKHGMK